MTNTEYIKEVAAAAGVTQKDIRDILRHATAVAYAHMKDENGVRIMDGITLSAVYKEGRTGRNPSTGESIQIAAKYAPKCKFGKAAKDAINA